MFCACTIILYYFWLLQSHQEPQIQSKSLSSPQHQLKCGGCHLTSLTKTGLSLATQSFSPIWTLVPPMSTIPLAMLQCNTLKVKRCSGNLRTCDHWDHFMACRSAKIHILLCKNCCINSTRKRTIVQHNSISDL